MHVIDVLTSPWAIVPEKLQEMIAIYRAHARGETHDFATIEAAIGKKLDNQPKDYKVLDGGVAVLPLEGVIAKRMNLFSRISGGVSTRMFERDLQAAVDDRDVQSIVLLIDSPGGIVDGTQAAMHAVRRAREQKRVVAVIDGQGDSAAYWIASAAEQIFIVDDTTEVGSIGVVAIHEDWSRYEDRLGVKVTEITAGRYKRIAGKHEPLSQEGRQYIQEQMDQIYTIFVNDVAANRDKDVETVLKDMADGRIFIGQKAVTAGLADGIKSLSAVITMLSESKSITGASAPKIKGASTMDKVLVCGVECATQEEVDKTVNAALEKASQEAKAQAEAGMNEKLEAARAEGAKAERERILAIEANVMPGHEKLIAEMKADGNTTGPEAAQRILAAEKAKREQVAKDLVADATNPAQASEGTGSTESTKRSVDPKEVAKAAEAYVAEQAKAGRRVSYAEAVKHVMAQGN